MLFLFEVDFLLLILLLLLLVEAGGIFTALILLLLLLDETETLVAVVVVVFVAAVVVVVVADVVVVVAATFVVFVVECNILEGVVVVEVVVKLFNKLVIFPYELLDVVVPVKAFKTFNCAAVSASIPPKYGCSDAIAATEVDIGFNSEANNDGFDINSAVKAASALNWLPKSYSNCYWY